MMPAKPSRSHRWLEYVLPVLIVLTWCLVAGWLVSGFREIRLSDVQPFILREVEMDLTSTDDLVDPYYPWGYPFVLGLVGESTGDYQRGAQALSLVGGAITLLAVWVICRTGFGWDVAAAATLLLAVNLEFNIWATAGSTDAPALGWLYAALAALAFYTRRPHIGWALTTGALLGVSYLVRYTSLTTLPVALLCLVALSRRPAPPADAHTAT